MGGLFSEKAWEVVLTHKASFLQGLGVTVESALGGIVIATVLGILLGLMGVSTRRLPKTINRIYVEAIQNTPLILQLCLLYYACSFSGHKIGVLAAGIIALGIYHGAYMAEVIRAGIESIPRGQFEAADAQGFDYTQKMAYIILPQTVKVILPPTVNQIGNLLYIIGGADLISSTYNFVTGANTGGSYAPAYIVCGVLFFIICFPLSTLAGRWEAKLKAQDEMMNA